MKNHNYIIHFTLILFLLSFLVSCEEDEQIDKSADQLFRPVLLSASVNGTDVRLSWVPIGGATYSLEVSKDSLLFSNELHVIALDGSKAYFDLENLWSSSRYSARIKAISDDGSLKDSGYKEITFFTGTENIFYEVLSENVENSSVVLRWIAGKNVTHIELIDGSSSSLTVQLSEEDIQLGQKKITGLTSATSYSCNIYNGEMLRGTISITTL